MRKMHTVNNYKSDRRDCHIDRASQTLLAQFFCNCAIKTKVQGKLLQADVHNFSSFLIFFKSTSNSYRLCDILKPTKMKSKKEIAMKEIQKLLDYRPEIRVLDATLRDGGLVNNFMFTDEFVQDLYKTNIKAGVDYMEFGYKADPDMFKESEFGKWKFSKDEDIRAIVGENDTDLKISIMADVGRCNYKRDILPRSESPIDMIRVACYIHQIPAAIEMIEDAHKKGYETTCNIMAISTSGENDWRAALDLVCKSSVDVIYIVDSYGSLYPEQIQRICALYKEYADKYKKEIGMHAHNNQQLAFANTIEACGDGVNFLDATYGMMGRGAGNCAIELLLGFLKNPKYNIYPALQFIENQIVPLKKQGVMWGYDIPYLLTGLLNQHPRDAIAFAGEKKTDYTEFWNTLTGKD